MAVGQSPKGGGRVRIGWIVGITVGVLIAGTGGYFIHTYQKHRNTLKLLKQAQQAQAQGDWETAATSYQLYLKREPSDVAVLSAYAEALLERLEESPEAAGDAVRTLRRLVRLEPDNINAIEKLVGLYLAFGEFGLAEEHAKKWAGLAPDSTDAALAVARARYGLHKYAEAAEGLIKAVERMPTESKLYPLLVALLAERLGKPEEAAGYLANALRVNPDSYAVHMAAFAFHKDQADVAKAETHLRRALELSPDTVEVLVPGAVFYISRNQLDDAQALLDRARTLSPGDRMLLSARVAWALKKNGAGQLTELADELMAYAGDRDLDLVARAAELYLRAGELDRADQCIQKLAAAPAGNNRIETWLNILKGARALLGGEPYVAIPYLQAVFRRQPSELWTAEVLANAYVKTGALEAAARMYRHILAAVPDTAPIRLALARLELQRGRLDEARKHAEILSEAHLDQAYHAELIRLSCQLEQAAQDQARPRQLQTLQTELERLATEHPTDTAAATLLARCFALSGQPVRAMHIFRSKLSDGTANVRMGAELGRTLLIEGLYEVAGQLADELIDRFPQVPEGHELYVKVMAATGRFTEAADYLDRSLRPPALKGRLWKTLGQEYLAADRVQSALEAFRHAATMLPGDVLVRQALLHATSDLDEARTLIDEIKMIEGEEGLHWRYERAWLLLQHDPSTETAIEAIELLRHCLTVRPTWVPARLLLAYAYEHNGQLEEAADSYRNAFAQQADLASSQIAIRLVKVLKQLGKFVEADGVLATLAGTLGDEPDVLRLQTERYLRKENLASAAATAERLLNLKPDDPAWAALTIELTLRAGNASQAERIARSTLANHPGSTLILWSFGQTLIAQDRSDEAETLIRETALAQNTATHFLLLAQLSAHLGKNRQAEAALDKAQELEPDSPAVYGALADFWGSRGDRAKQLAFARKAVELRGEHPGESLALARLLATGDPNEQRDEAAAIVQRRLSANPDDVGALLLQAQLGLAESPADLGKAEQAVRRALSIDPRSPQGHKILAAVQLRFGRVAQASDTVAAGLAFAPQDPDLLQASAEMCVHRGRYHRAIPLLQRLLELKPRNAAVLRLLADAYQNTEQIDQAIETIAGQAPEADWNATEATILAKLYEFKGEFDRAEALLLRALEMNPRSSEAFQEYIHYHARREAFDKVYALTSQRRVEVPEDIRSLAMAGEILGASCPDTQLRSVGMEWLEAIANDHPDHAADAAYRSGACYYQRGDLDRAEALFQRASKLAPLSPRPINALAWLYSEDLDRPAEALAMIERYIAGGGQEDAALLDTHGTVLLRLGRISQARQMLTKSLAMAGQTPTLTAASYHLGLVLLEGGDDDEALAYVRRALKSNQRLAGLTEGEEQRARHLVSESARKN